MNTFENKGIPIGQLEQKNVSTKGANHGIGLYNVCQILNRYPKVWKSTEIRDGYFVQTLVMQG